MISAGLKKENERLKSAMENFEKKYKEKFMEEFKCKDVNIEYFKAGNTIKLKKDGLILSEFNISSNQKENLSKGEMMKAFKQRIQELKDIANEIEYSTMIHK